MMGAKNKKIEEILNKGVDEIISERHLEEGLQSGRKLRVKFGIDPTSADLHLGHSIPLRKLREFQELGHQVVFLIGDFTAIIGDPSARATARRPLTLKEIRKNMADYTNQAAKILNMKKVEVRYNSEWYNQKGAKFLMDLSSRFTFARLIERSEFKKRIAKDIDITMLELLYPLMQGYDSVELRADVEIGGTDQKFNLLMGRKVQKKYNQPQQDIITLPLLMGTDGALKMSKSYNNYIKLTETAPEMYGKIMSISDTLIWHYFKLLTYLSLEEIEEIKSKTHKTIIFPREAKSRLAREVVSIYHSQKAALTAEKEFNQVFREKKLPSKIPEVKIREVVLNVLDLLVKTKLVHSKTEAKRLVAQGGVKIDSKVKKNWQEVIKIRKGTIVQIGKRRLAKVE